jgi:hypothetical protein
MEARLVNNELKTVWDEVVVAYYADISLEGLVKTTRSPCGSQFINQQSF